MWRTACQPLAIVAQNPVCCCVLVDAPFALGSVGRQSDLSAALILLFGTPGYGDGANDVTTLDDG